MLSGNFWFVLLFSSLGWNTHVHTGKYTRALPHTRAHASWEPSCAFLDCAAHCCNILLMTYHSHQQSVTFLRFANLHRFPFPAWFCISVPTSWMSVSILSIQISPWYCMSCILLDISNIWWYPWYFPPSQFQIAFYFIKYQDVNALQHSKYHKTTETVPWFKAIETAIRNIYANDVCTAARLQNSWLVCTKSHIWRHRKRLYDAADSMQRVYVCKAARCGLKYGVNLFHHELKADLIIKHIDVEMRVLKCSLLADLEAVRDRAV